MTSQTLTNIALTNIAIILLCISVFFIGISNFSRDKTISDNRSVITQQTEIIKLISDEIINLKNK